jgi:hypothetical protein
LEYPGAAEAEYFKDCFGESNSTMAGYSTSALFVCLKADTPIKYCRLIYYVFWSVKL